MVIPDVQPSKVQPAKCIDVPFLVSGAVSVFPGSDDVVLRFFSRGQRAFQQLQLGANLDELGPRFPDMTEAYSPAHRRIAKEAAAQLGVDLQEGVYAAMLGPSYETPAEIRFLKVIGADLVGMSTVPETIVAK